MYNYSSRVKRGKIKCVVSVGVGYSKRTRMHCVQASETK